MFINNKTAIAIASKIVAQHAPIILERLGLAQDNDGILDRIYVIADPLTKEHNASAVFYHVDIHTGLFGSGGSRYERYSGKIVVNAASMFYFYSKKKGYKEVKFVRLMVGIFGRRRFEEYMLFLLAHEMRHYWQWYTGEIWKNSSRAGSINFMPYEWRWEEQDANEFAYNYVREMKQTLKGGEKHGKEGTGHQCNS